MNRIIISWLKTGRKENERFLILFATSIISDTSSVCERDWMIWKRQNKKSI